MIKTACIVLFVAAVASAGILHAPLVASPAAIAAVPAPIVTARSSQVVARNYNTFAAAPLAYTAAVPAAVHAAIPAASAPITLAAAAPAAPLPYAALAYTAHL